MTTVKGERLINMAAKTHTSISIRDLLFQLYVGTAESDVGTAESDFVTGGVYPCIGGPRYARYTSERFRHTMQILGGLTGADA